MSSLQFVVHPIPGNEDQLNDRFVKFRQRHKRPIFIIQFLDNFFRF